jgi:hypothetical protein
MMNEHNRRIATSTAAAAVAACLLLSACTSSTSPLPGHESTAVGPPTAGNTGNASTPPPGGAAADPCSLLTEPEVDIAAGQPLGRGNRIGALDDCQWSTTDLAGSVELDVADWSTIKTKSAQIGMPLTSVAGVGDEALSLNQAGNAAQLYVRKGNTGFLLILGGGQYVGSLPDLGLAQEKILAAAVLGRI